MERLLFIDGNNRCDSELVSANGSGSFLPLLRRSFFFFPCFNFGSGFGLLATIEDETDSLSFVFFTASA
jgi:hypothetical protein